MARLNWDKCRFRGKEIEYTKGENERIQATRWARDALRIKKAKEEEELTKRLKEKIARYKAKREAGLL